MLYVISIACSTVNISALEMLFVKLKFFLIFHCGMTIPIHKLLSLLEPTVNSDTVFWHLFYVFISSGFYLFKSELFLY